VGFDWAKIVPDVEALIIFTALTTSAGIMAFRRITR